MQLCNFSQLSYQNFEISNQYSDKEVKYVCFFYFEICILKQAYVENTILKFFIALKISRLLYWLKSN